MVQEGLVQDRVSRTPSLAPDDEKDKDFVGSDEDEEDDERTIAKAEKKMKVNIQEELSALNAEGQKDLDDLLSDVSILS